METVYEASNVCITALLSGENCLHVNITKFIYVNMYIAYWQWSEQEASSPLYSNISLKYAIRKVQGNQNILNGTCQILVHADDVIYQEKKKCTLHIPETSYLYPVRGGV